MSLPLAFDTRLETIPAPTPYLRAHPARVAKWRERLGMDDVVRVGLRWSGRPSHANDRNRSIPLRELSKLLTDGVQFVSLQMDVNPADTQALRNCSGLRHFGAELADFADTAALIECLDLVISVDTAVAHLAGALGKPVWILLPFAPDWRWLLERSDSPWYPSARLFRQPSLGDWGSVIEQVRAELKRCTESSIAPL